MLERLATGFCYLYTGAFVTSFLALGFAALVGLVVVIAGFTGLL